MRPDPNSGIGTPDEASVEVPKKKDDKYEDLSEEDLELKQHLEWFMEMIHHEDQGLQKLALIFPCRQKIQKSTSSMTFVPKPLRFLRPHYQTLKTYFEAMDDSDAKKFLADILSVVAMTMSTRGERESLKYRLLGSGGDIDSWGHEYIRSLAGEIPQEFMERQSKDSFQSEDDFMDVLMELLEQVVAFYMEPRMLMAVDENLKPLPVPVRVSKAADVVGQGGQPETITRFQSHLTPVILAAGDRAVLDTKKYIPLSPILEGFVILQENPDYCEDN